MTSLIRYEAACRAIAEARAIDEVLSIRDESQRMRLYAQQAKDRELMADAVEIRLRAERQLGVLLKAAKEAGQIIEGRRPKNCQEDVQFPRVTLEEAGIDRNLSSVAQKRASISEQAFEMVVTATRERLISDRAKIIDAPRPGEGSRVQAAGDRDFSPTPPWATRALIEHVFAYLERRGHCKFQTAWEPACGEGHIAEVLSEYFLKVYASDLHEYGYGDASTDFLSTKLDGFDWIITNPPFEDRVQKFILQALASAGAGVAMFLQLRQLEGISRYQEVYRDHPPTVIAPFVERVPLVMDHYDPEASTTTAFMWLVWIKGAAPRAPFWIPPGCRKGLTRPDDAARFTAKPVRKREKIKEGEAA